MRILLDQGTPVGIKRFLGHHTVNTAYELGWSTLLNGELLRVAEKSNFDVFVTTDQNLVYQQNVSQRRIAILVLGQARWRAIKAEMGKVVAAIESAKPGSYIVVEVSESA